VRAAHDLLLENGYVGTTLSAIAERAGVSVQTVYAQFGNKPAIVKQVVDEAIAGDDEPLAIDERPGVLAQKAEPDPHVRIRLHARDSAERMTRIEPVDRMLRSAADSDPAMRAQLESGAAALLAGMLDMAQFYDARDELAVDPETAAQRIAALMSPELYRRTVIEHGWTEDAYVEWTGDLMATSILKPARRRR
jgi:AcrR family transcriptional regulator